MSEQRADVAELQALKEQFLERAEREPDYDLGTLFDEVTRIRFGRMLAATILRGHPSS